MTKAGPSVVYEIDFYFVMEIVLPWLHIWINSSYIILPTKWLEELYKEFMHFINCLLHYKCWVLHKL